jgi:hypothetical protein
VAPAGTPQWERTATAWLLDQCPAEYRGYPVLLRHPVALVHVAAQHVDAALTATRQARSTARAALGGALTPPTLAELLEALDQEEARLLAASRAVALLAQALAGRRFVPRL